MFIDNKVTKNLNKELLKTFNSVTSKPLNKGNIININRSVASKYGESASNKVSTLDFKKNYANMTIPILENRLKKGQKRALVEAGRQLKQIKACFGWDIMDPRCDIDVSAFLVTASKQVYNDDWFVFYGQKESPDNGVIFNKDVIGIDKEYITIDFEKLDRRIEKIVFVLTINEALEKNLNFSMLKDAYIRIIDCITKHEIISYWC